MLKMDAKPAGKSAADPVLPAKRPGWKRPLFVWPAGLILAGLLGWFVAAHVGAWKDRLVPRKWRVVEPGQIYASGQIDRHLIRQILVDNHIKEIICLLGDDLIDPDVAAERQAAADLGIERHNYNLSGDGTGDIRQYADAVTELVAAQKAGRSVLVHCSSGAQRSNGTTYFYRVLIQHQDANQAAAEMLRNGHNPRENPLLIPYLNEHMAEMAAILAQRGVIDQIPGPIPQIQHE
jgi:protein tyrosine phosphatase (PTP) superfamily phosphohydrolase (DUF442 family)